MFKSVRLILALAASAALAACGFAGRDLEPPPAIYVFKYQQVWLTSDQREAAQCWNGAALLCAGSFGRLATQLCECPL